MTSPLLPGEPAVDTAPSIDDLIRHSQLPRAEARRLLACLTSQPLTWFMAHGDDPADPNTATRFQALAERRRAGEPLAYLLGQQEFYGRPFAVSPTVLIPRADTETLVETALEQLLLLRQQRCAVPLSLLELGTGSGIIAITLALEAPDTEVHAVERSLEALAVAQQNAKALGAARIHWHAGSWWQALASPRRFDLIVSNPPYIAANDHHLQQGDLRFEPPQALAAGPDGLDDLRIIIGGAPAHLNPGGGWKTGSSRPDQVGPTKRAWPDQANQTDTGRTLNPITPGPHRCERQPPYRNQTERQRKAP